MQQLKRLPSELELESKLKKATNIKGKPTAEQLKSVGVKKQKENEENQMENKKLNKETFKTILITVLIAIIVLIPAGAMLGWKLHEVVNSKANEQIEKITKLKD